MVLGLVPARGGSKGIPRKNLARVAGKPLLTWTLDAARAARELTHVVVSTDDDEIAAAAAEVEVLRRPAELATDETPMLDVVRHAVAELAPEIVVLLQPTSPLRRAEHVDEVVPLLRDTGADAVVSVVEVPHRFRPSSLMELRDGRLRPLVDERYTRRQDKPLVYARNGPAILALRADRLGDDLYAGDVRPYTMRAPDSIDVDDEDDLLVADALLRAR